RLTANFGRAKCGISPARRIVFALSAMNRRSILRRESGATSIGSARNLMCGTISAKLLTFYAAKGLSIVSELPAEWHRFQVSQLYAKAPHWHQLTVARLAPFRFRSLTSPRWCSNECIGRRAGTE